MQKRIIIGNDCLITKGVSIIDSNFHHLAYDNIPVNPQADVLIGDNVWICPDSTILKGAVIAEGCIIGHKSVVPGKVFPKNCFIAGVPAKVVKTNCSWKP